MRSTTIPEIGDVTTMRVALFSADVIALYARSRWISRMRRSASAALRFKSNVVNQLFLPGVGLFEPLFVLFLIDAAEVGVLLQLRRAFSTAFAATDSSVSSFACACSCSARFSNLLFEIA